MNHRMQHKGIGFVTRGIQYCCDVQHVSFLGCCRYADGRSIFQPFHHVLQNKASATVLTPRTILTGCDCLIPSHWQARLSWSPARDNDPPRLKYLACIHSSLRVLLWGHLVSRPYNTDPPPRAIGACLQYDPWLLFCLVVSLTPVPFQYQR